MILDDILNSLYERRYYTGKPLESGGTSIASSGENREAPAVRQMIKSGIIKEGMKIMDYGSGKFGRNANYLREQGFQVYAYDPFNGVTQNEGWGNTATTYPRNMKFDLVFTSFVLNVVPYNIEKNILQQTKSIGNKVAHIVRDMDIVVTVTKALNSTNANPSKNFFMNEYAVDDEELQEKLTSGTLSKDDIIDFCIYGVQTSRGFQRLVFLEENGYNKVAAKNGGWRLYVN